MMTRHHLVAAMLALSLPAGATVGARTAQSSPSAEGHWEGAIQVPGQELAIAVDLIRKGEVWEGTIAIPAQNVKGFALSAVTVQDDAVSFAMKGVPGEPTFKGKLTSEPRSLAGDFTQGGATFPFTLAWKGAPQIEAALTSTKITAELEGAWDGALSVGGTTLRLALRLENAGDAAKGVIVSVDQGGAEIPITQIVQDGQRVDLVVRTISARYTGELSAGTIAGKWTQGGQTLPLDFKRRN